MTLKLMTVVGTRPEIIKMSSVIKKADVHFEHFLVHTGQNYDFELNEVFFNDLGIRKPDYFLSSAGKTPAETIANVIFKVDELIEKIKPDAFLIYGDTNSCLCVISAKRKQIPIFHLEAGNRCFDQRVPEEINRKIVDHLSDVNMVHSEHARGYLLKEGLRPELVFKTGSPMKEIFNSFSLEIENSVIHDKLMVKEGDYFLVSMHREENVDYPSNLQSLLEALDAVGEEFGKRVLVSTHPRTQKAISQISYKSNEYVQFLKPMGFFDYIKLQSKAVCVLSDSGTITEESSILKFPAVMIRQAHERPEGMDVGALIMSGIKALEVVNSIKLTLSLQCDKTSMIDSYDRESFSSQVIKIIQSYTSYINRTVWGKNV